MYRQRLGKMKMVLACCLLALITPGVVMAWMDAEKDFMTEMQQRAEFCPGDFVFNFSMPDATNANGNLRPNTIAQNRVLGTLPGNGGAQNLVTIEACGVNQPHVHPRGTEISFITQGKLFFGFLEENGPESRFISANMTQGQSVVIPQGLIHFAQNLGCEPAQFLANFPTRDPGTVTIASNFFKLPAVTLRATLGTDDYTIQKVADAAKASMNPSADPECLKYCGLA